jgi:transposase-like protein
MITRMWRKGERFVFETEDFAIIGETLESGMAVSIIARRHGLAPNRLFTWRRLAQQDVLTATQAETKLFWPRRSEASKRKNRKHGTFSKNTTVRVLNAC